MGAEEEDSGMAALDGHAAQDNGGGLFILALSPRLSAIASVRSCQSKDLHSALRDRSSAQPACIMKLGSRGGCLEGIETLDLFQVREGWTYHATVPSNTGWSGTGRAPVRFKYGRTLVPWSAHSTQQDCAQEQEEKLPYFEYVRAWLPGHG